MLLPGPIQDLINALSRLPGIGPKTASRLTFFLLHASDDLAQDLAAGGDTEMFQDLLLTAVNGALDASRKLAEQRLGPLAGGLPF